MIYTHAITKFYGIRCKLSLKDIQLEYIKRWAYDYEKGSKSKQSHIEQSSC